MKTNKELSVIAVVVTYNRLSLLTACLQSLRTNSPQAIIVVDNGCTDGTGEWLNTQSDLHVIHQQNVGGSGGFHRGMSEAIQMGADWIWCMDDDVKPHPDCLSHLLPYTSSSGAGILAPRRLMEGKVFTNDFRRYNLRNPFASMYQDRLKGKHVDCPTTIVGTAFEGLFVSRQIVEQIGLPNKDLFIFCDDTDFCLRAHLAGFSMLYIPEALMDKKHFFSEETWAERQQKKKWKRSYQVRNSTYLNHHYGRNWAVRYLRGLFTLLGYLFTILFTAPVSRAYRWRDALPLIRAYQSGIREELGIIHF